MSGRGAACVKDYPTPALNADAFRKPLLTGRHLIILNRGGRLAAGYSLVSKSRDH